MKTFGLLLLALLPLAGCSSVSARRAVSLDGIQRIHVVKSLNDNHRLAELLAAELRRLGREASAGPRTMMPDKTDAVLTYADRWKWDFRDYLIELNLALHTPYSNQLLADARYHQPSVTTKPPADAIRELLAELFPQRRLPAGDPAARESM